MKISPLVFTFALLSFSLPGCSSSSETVVGPDGSKATVDKSSGTVKVSDGNTTAELGGSTSITEAELGVEFYPGSSEKAGSTFRVNSGGEKDAATARTTSDDPAKVTDFYKGKLKNPIVTDVAGKTLIVGQADSGATLNITVEKKDGQTEITYGSKLPKS